MLEHKIDKNKFVDFCNGDVKGEDTETLNHFDEHTRVFRIKKSDDLELSKGSGGIPHCEAYRCSSCKKILIDYANR